MGERKICNKCDGTGYIDVLVNAHDDEKETITCDNCSGKKEIYYMSDDDENDYHADYW